MRCSKNKMDDAPTSREYFAIVARHWDEIWNGYFGGGIRDDAIAGARLSVFLALGTKG